MRCKGSPSPALVTDQHERRLGVDLGPNLSITGSLATILWLAALRRDALEVSALRFLRIGLIVMPPALVLAILATNSEAMLLY